MRKPTILAVLVLAVLAACSTTYHTVKLVNRTDRAIEEVYLFPTGATNHGSSRATLAPNASVDVRVAAGNVDVLAVSAKVRVDEKTRETRTATQTFELRGPLELVFHDSNKPPPGLARSGTLGVAFRVEAEAPATTEDAPAPDDTPAP